MVAAFFVAAACEEEGWTGYATDALQERYSAVATGLVIGSVWAAWHIIPYVQAGHSVLWIAWQCVAPVALRVLIVWLHNNTGRSVFIACVFHTMINVSTALFPTKGSRYDPAAPRADRDRRDVAMGSPDAGPVSLRDLSRRRLDELQRHSTGLGSGAAQGRSSMTTSSESAELRDGRLTRP
ncbi:CPBP family intramembrane glutamic endopeptidase [Cryptosporangium sp. NPDC048952]|uniref:CPBP family intramembrane glutamic endopeptidase n=1 Tax=Cryptosporangium sp. NPDC048952 TaxID=3363961 RepID=UPI00372413E6